MMKGLWQTWSTEEGGSVAASTASAATHPPLNTKNRTSTATTTTGPRHRQLPMAPLPSHLLQDDPSIMDIEDEDQLAGRLLIQFPTYGSHNAHAANLPIHPTADWLLGGTSNIPSASALQKTSKVRSEEQDQGGDNDNQNSPEDNDNNKQSNTNASSSNNNNNNNNNNAQAVNSENWDEDEQKLWKSPKLPHGMHESLSNRQAALTSSTDKQHPPPRTNVHWKQQQQLPLQLTDPSRDWLQAYYYHTGVTPKVSARREPIERMTVPRKSFAISTALDQNQQQRYQANAAMQEQQKQQQQQQQQMPEMMEDYPDNEETTTTNNIDEQLIMMSPPATTTGGAGGPTPTSSSTTGATPKVSSSSSSPSTGGTPTTPGIIGARPTPTDALTLAPAPAVVDDRQHWMPDQLCKHCYACDTPFTVFRRRHHCRLCGQVFCNSCSGYFVPGGVQPSSHAHVLEQQHQGSSQQPLGYQQTLAPGQGQQQQQSGPSSKTILRTCKMCFEQVTAQQQQQLEEISILDFKKRKKNNQEDSNSSNKPLPPPPPPPPPVMPTVTSSTLLKDLETDSVLHSLSKKQSAEKSFLAKRLLLSQQQAMEQEEKEQTSLLLLQHQQQPHRKHEPVPSPSKQPTTTTSSTGPSRSPGIRSDNNNNNNNNTSSASSPPSDNQDKTAQAYRHLGLTAAAHLEQVGRALLASDAPLLWQEVAAVSEETKWVNKLMSLATRCCATVEPNVKKGDLLDIRPYCKIKVIPGGSYQDCAYMSGVLFRKTLSHKRTAKEISNPRIMLLSGGIEFTRTENRIASLDTMLEQEGKYMEILVGKILKLQPDILMVGRSVSRKAQELLLKANVVLLQHVKSTLLSRISRQTGATIISSTDHIMNQFGANVLGKCHRFRFIVARDNEVWIDGDNDIPPINFKKSVDKKQRNIRALLEDDGLPNHERQAALAANMLGQGVVDGTEAVKCGLAKRGVAQTYVMLEGCPKHLGCTVVLRGASRAALKQAKIVFRFLVNVAYNLKLETSYFKERCVALRPNFSVQPKNLFSSSLCVDYGQASGSRKIRPWNGGTNHEQSISGNVTAFDHQSILITSVWMTDKTQCCPAEVKGICYYSLQDVSLGQFLRDSCFNLSLKCQNPNCKKSVLDHSLSFVHNDGLINITVDHMDGPLPPAPVDGTRKADDNNKSDDEDGEEIEDSPIATWTFCKHCNKVVTPLVYISENTWKYSFGKFLESFFYNRDAVMNSPEHGCSCELQTSATLFFGCGRLAARLTYERVRPFGVFVRKSLPIDSTFHRGEAFRQLEQISMASSQLFVKFDKHIEKVSREARLLYGNSANRPEHLQTVLSELNRISSEVDHAAKTLQEKIASVSDKCSKDDDGVVTEALFRFPWFSRRYLFMLTSAWNEKLSAAGQAIVAMKKLATSASLRMDPSIPTIVGDPISEELHEGMRRLRQLHEVYSRYNLTDITTQLPIIPGTTTRSEIEYNDDDFEDPDGAIEYAEGVDADVLASRRRLYNTKPTTSIQPEGDRNETNRRPTKSLGTRRSDDPQLNRANQHRLTADAMPNATVSAKVTPGGAVKSAITRFFNRGGRELDPYVVDLGIFNEGRPRLEPGVNGIVVPVVDEQMCTVIAYSLSSTEYANQFQNFSKLEATGPDNSSELPNYGSNNDGSGQQRGQNYPKTPQRTPGAASGLNNKQDIERRMLVRNKSHIKHTFRDFDEKGQNLCKFVCTTYWATQFHAVRQVFLSPSGGKDQPDASTAFQFHSELDVEQSYVQSLSSAYSWAASGGKSGASFARTRDDRFVIKCISRTELQMFLDCAPAYFEYLSKAFFHGLPTVLCKIVGVYQIGYHNRVTGKRSMEQVAVMQNIFYNRRITKIFDLKGSLRGRFAAQVQSAKDGTQPETPAHSEASSRPRKRGSEHGSDSGFPKLDGDSEGGNDGNNGKAGSGENGEATGTLLDGDFLDFTAGRPMPMDDRAKAVFHMSILNDTLFLSIINVLDYSILVGIDEDTMELVVGVIDFMRQYDILKQMERVGKSLPMVVGSEAPTIIQPPLYKARFTNAMERYFMTVPSKWTTI